MQLAKLQLPDVREGHFGSVLNIKSRMRYGQYVWDEQGVPNGPIFIRIDLRAQTISVFRSGHEIGTAVILYGADEKPTPTGSFEIIQRLKDHRSSLYDAPMPYTLRLTTDGIAIHGSDVRQGAATHGCIGVPTAFASLLFEVAKAGDKVVII
jgi:lipoprotein-anchoring transpeptidase ErfK/SrfK